MMLVFAVSGVFYTGIVIGEDCKLLKQEQR